MDRSYFDLAIISLPLSNSAMQWSELTSFYRQGINRDFVLVTMVAKQGSSYRQPGARMLVRDDQAICGSVSAGCLEDEIARATEPVFRDRVPRLLTIDTRPHYGCPGQITLLLEVLRPTEGAALFTQIEAHLLNRSPFTVVTDYRDLNPAGALTALSTAATTSLAALPNVLAETVGRRPRLVVVGGGDDATAVSKAALLAKWDVQTVAPTDIQFAPNRLITDFPPDNRTAIVFMTHNLGCDVACLQAVLPQAYSYIGVIGSGRRRRELVSGLEHSADPLVLENLEKLFCPAGLDLGANDTGDIAISILAEIQCLWSGRDASSLRMRMNPIHCPDASVASQ